MQTANSHTHMNTNTSKVAKNTETQNTAHKQTCNLYTPLRPSQQTHWLKQECAYTRQTQLHKYLYTHTRLTTTYAETKRHLHHTRKDPYEYTISRMI